MLAPTKPILRNGTQLSDDSTHTAGSNSVLRSQLVDITKQLKLILVTFREAALDSPSFRAATNHLDTQVLNIEKWIIALAALVAKIPRLLKELRSFSNLFLEYLVPHFLQDGLIDLEYTESALQNTVEGMGKMWKIGFDLLSVSQARVDAVKDTVLQRIAQYRRRRRAFQSLQRKYDRFLQVHMATPKTKDAALVMEDSVQLFNVRKQYIAECLGITLELNSIADAINSELVKLGLGVILTRKPLVVNNPALSSLLAEYVEKALRIQAWCDQNTVAVTRMLNEMLLARKQVEENTIARLTPSTSVADYAVATINQHSFMDGSETNVEKQGHLFMKTTERLNKPIWVKRWAFLRGGVFGLLTLSPSQTLVQELDKFGVLSCSTKFTPNEDRRFCFEVKTVDVTVVFQTETSQELRLWLSVFDNARRRISSATDPMRSLIDVASGRYPPLVAEFSDSSNSSTDKQITSASVTNSDGQVIATSRLSSHIQSHEQFFQRHIYKQATLILLPLSTETTRSSVIAYSLIDPTPIPTALSANIWGSLNWGLYFLNDMSDPDESDIPLDDFEQRDGNGISMPHMYPDDWWASELQMRALFENTVNPDECCLVSFRCLWLPNSRQELRGTVFVLQRHIYSYIFSLGFVSLSKILVRRWAEVICIPKKNYDVLKMHHVEGLLRMKIFLEDGQLIAKKILLIINNAASDQPDGVNTLIEKLQEVEAMHNQDMLRQRQQSVSQPVPFASDSFDRTNLLEDGRRLFKINYKAELPLTLEAVFPVPPKALFHMLFGYESNIIDELVPFMDTEVISKAKWVQQDSQLHREYVSRFLYEKRRLWQLHVRQVIEQMADNEYYNGTVTFSTLKVRWGAKLRVFRRFVIYSQENGHSMLRVYSEIRFSHKLLLNPLLRQLCISFTKKHHESLHNRLEKAASELGPGGPELKAIYHYGKIPITDEHYVTPVPPPAELDFATVFSLFVKTIILTAYERCRQVLLKVWSVVGPLIGSLTSHRLLLGVIFLLCFLNVMLAKRSTQSYWNASAAREVVKDIVNFEPIMMQRAIYSKDIQQLVESKELFGRSLDSLCFATFRNTLFVMNYDQPFEWKRLYDDDFTRLQAQKLRQTLQELGIRRNDLLVSLRMLNQIEEEVAMGEWRNWLANEVNKCELVLRKNITGDAGDDVSVGLKNLIAYCECCSLEMKALERKAL